MSIVITMGGSSGGGGGGSVANANDVTGPYFTLDAGQVGSGVFSWSFWVKPTTLSFDVLSVCATNGEVRGRIGFLSGVLRLHGIGTDNGSVCLLAYGTTVLALNTLYHVCGYFDLSSTSTRAVIINRASETMTWSTYRNTALDIGGNFTGVYNAAPGATSTYGRFEGETGECWLAPGQSFDVSNVTNLNKFITTGGVAVNLGATGATPTGTAPRIFFSGAGADFATNKGTGGTFTQAGSGSITATSTALDV